jgi:hypothetical protein
MLERTAVQPVTMGTPSAFSFWVALSSIPTTKNKIHHSRAEIRQDSDHPFREKPLCTREVG